MRAPKIDLISIESNILIEEINEFNGRWAGTQALAADRLTALLQVATIESLGSTDWLKYSTKDDRRRGDHKKFTNSVKAFGSDGKSHGVIFHTATPLDTPALKSELVPWNLSIGPMPKAKIKRRELHPLLVTAIYVVTYRHIHLFQHGNSRLPRALTTLLLMGI